MTVLVTGGAGYIGSVTVDALVERGLGAVVLDDLSCGHRGAVDEDVPFYEGKAGDRELVKQIVSDHGVDACIHFAAFTYVGESVADPAKYFENNTGQTMHLLGALRESGVGKFVFSSTCATYGDPQRMPIDEQHRQQPVNPYGWSKLMSERILDSYASAYGMRYASLRYFNAAGATARRGEHHDPETHLIPIVLSAAARELPVVPVFGDDYDTPDGTCIRDYIHVSDLADAHLDALGYLDGGGAPVALNLGNGRGFSVLDVIETARRVTQRPIEIAVMPRREGDPDRLVADAATTAEVLGWQPRHADLEDIIASAWVWKRANPRGYTD